MDGLVQRRARRWMRRQRSAIHALVTVVAVFVGIGRAQAEPSPDDKALATTLFKEGRTLMSAGRIAEACLKLEESERLDPGGGTILNLALCHEQEGRLARSWSEFNEAVVRARKDGRRDREVEAAEHARVLEPRLSRLTVSVPAGAEVPGLQIERDGRELGKGAWSTAMPVDGGEHIVRATAPGKAPFTAKVEITKESDARTIEIPILATPVVVVTPPRYTVPASESVLVLGPTRSPEAARRLRWTAIGTAAVGVAALGTAGYLLVTALGKKSDSNADCTGDICGPNGLQQRKDAVSRGNLATIFGVGGAVLAAAGVSLFLYERRSSVPNREARIATRFMLGAAPSAVVTGVEGRF